MYFLSCILSFRTFSAVLLVQYSVCIVDVVVLSLWLTYWLWELESCMKVDLTNLLARYFKVKLVWFVTLNCLGFLLIILVRVCARDVWMYVFKNRTVQKFDICPDGFQTARNPPFK